MSPFRNLSTQNKFSLRHCVSLPLPADHRLLDLAAADGRQGQHPIALQSDQRQGGQAPRGRCRRGRSRRQVRD